jgi:hypothetical protein
MTEQYLVGQFSSLLEDFEDVAADCVDAVHRLRLVVEGSQPAALPSLAGEVLRLSDAICWGSLRQGDVARFCRCATSAAEFAEFVRCAWSTRN